MQLRALADPRLRGVLLLALVFGVCLAAADIFVHLNKEEPIIPGPGVTNETRLSTFAPALAGTPADTRVFVLEGDEPGGTMLLLGGVHAEEISGLLGAILVVENVVVRRGRLIVIPQANSSGFTYTTPMEAFADGFEIETPGGLRRFRNGMRRTNPAHQWPDPDVFVHPQSGRQQVGWEARNLNRNFPGDSRGSLTARLGAAIMDIAVTEGVSLVYDMHEASPEYPVNNILIAHQRGFEVATLALWALEARGVDIGLQASPETLRGLSHREFGDNTPAVSFLSETANPAKGRLRGTLSPKLVVDGTDANYQRAAGLGLLFVPFDAAGHPLAERTARNLATFEELTRAWNEVHPDQPMLMDGLPAAEDVMAIGLGAFLRPPPN